MARATSRLALRAARPEEAASLTALAFASKRLWGYDEDFMARTGSELVLTEEMIARHPTTVCERDGRVAGFSMLVVSDEEAEVELLFVAPDAVRSGVGRALWRRLVEDAVVRGARTMAVTADPNAEGFYRRMGAVRTGTVASTSIPGRHLPRLTFPLAHAP